jgi:hypothetical protein
LEGEGVRVSLPVAVVEEEGVLLGEDESLGDGDADTDGDDDSEAPEVALGDGVEDASGVREGEVLAEDASVPDSEGVA